jgi:hypothetical protein
VADDEDVPDPLANLDQAMAELRTMGRILRAHFDAMVSAGFDVTQALKLTIGYQQAIWGKAPEA